MTRHLIAGAAALAIMGLGFLAWNALVPRERDTPIFVPVPEREMPASDPAAVEDGTPTPDAASAESACASVPAPDLPPLDESDDFVRMQMDDCLAGIVRGGWPNGLPGDQPNDLLRRAVATLANAAQGELSRNRFALLKPPAGEFSVETSGGRHYIADAAFARYDAMLDALICVPPERVASTLRLLRPLLDQALRELGLPQTDFDAVVDGALAAILAAESPPLPIEIVPAGALWHYADAELEAASPLRKQLLRLGPDNLIRLQRYAEQLRNRLRQPDTESMCVDDLDETAAR